MKRFLIGIAIFFGVVIGAVVVMYFFGTPTAGSTVAAAPGTASVSPGVAQAGSGGPGGPPLGGAVDPNAKAPAADPRSPLAIQIPGCKCHSDDSKLVKQHEQYRMNQCAGCHAGAPTGQ